MKVENISHSSDADTDARTVRSRQEMFNSNGGHEAWFLTLLTPNNYVVYGQKHKVWVLVFLVRMRGTC